MLTGSSRRQKIFIHGGVTFHPGKVTHRRKHEIQSGSRANLAPGETLCYAKLI